MNIYWIGAALGFIGGPWLLANRMLKMAFEERGLAGGFGAWTGLGVLCAAIVLGGMWIGEILF